VTIVLASPDSGDAVRGVMRFLPPDSGVRNAGIRAALVELLELTALLENGGDAQTAIKVTDGVVEVVSEGQWKLPNPAS
jgi:hypothetical protein